MSVSQQAAKLILQQGRTQIPQQATQHLRRNVQQNWHAIAQQQQIQRHIFNRNIQPQLLILNQHPQLRYQMHYWHWIQNPMTWSMMQQPWARSWMNVFRHAQRAPIIPDLQPPKNQQEQRLLEPIPVPSQIPNEEQRAPTAEPKPDNKIPAKASPKDLIPYKEPETALSNIQTPPKDLAVSKEMEKGIVPYTEPETALAIRKNEPNALMIPQTESTALVPYDPGNSNGENHQEGDQKSSKSSTFLRNLIVGAVVASIYEGMKKAIEESKNKKKKQLGLLEKAGVLKNQLSQGYYGARLGGQVYDAINYALINSSISHASKFYRAKYDPTLIESAGAIVLANFPKQSFQLAGGYLGYKYGEYEAVLSKLTQEETMDLIKSIGIYSLGYLPEKLISAIPDKIEKIEFGIDFTKKGIEYIFLD